MKKNCLSGIKEGMRKRDKVGVAIKGQHEESVL